MIVVVFLNNMSAHTIYISNKKILINCDIGPGETDCIRLQPISCFRPPVNLPVHLELRLYPDVSLRNFGFNVWKYASMYRSYQAPKLREFIKIEKCVWFVFRANSVLVNPKEEAGVVLICLIWCFIFDAFMQTSSNTVQMSWGSDECGRALLTWRWRLQSSWSFGSRVKLVSRSVWWNVLILHVILRPNRYHLNCLCLFFK